jgi:hypothetical protein
MTREGNNLIAAGMAILSKITLLIRLPPFGNSAIRAEPDFAAAELWDTGPMPHAKIGLQRLGDYSTEPTLIHGCGFEDIPMNKSRTC